MLLGRIIVRFIYSLDICIASQKRDVASPALNVSNYRLTIGSSLISTHSVSSEHI